MSFLKNNDTYYIVHREIPIHNFTSKSGVMNMEMVKLWRDYLIKVDHVLRTETSFIFVETIQDAQVLEELVEETHN
mgnify:FL=1